VASRAYQDYIVLQKQIIVVASLVCMNIRISHFQDHHVPTKLDKDSAPRTRKATKDAPRPILDTHKQCTRALLCHPQLRRAPRTCLSIASALHQPRRAPRLLVTRLHWLYYAYAVHPDAPSRRSTSRQSVALALVVCLVTPLCVVTTCLVAATDILCLRHVYGCLGTSRGSSRGSSLTTSTTPRVRVPRHLTWLVARLVAPLVID
jgi:hypothetical protein